MAGHGSYETGCYGKDKHASKVAADNQCVKRPGAGKIRGVKKLHSYRCEFCGFWHVGGDNRDRRRPYNRRKNRAKW